MKKNTLYLALASALVMPVLAHAVANTKATVIGSSATSTNSPAGESVGMAVDGNTGSKYLNFDKLNTGLMVTLDAPRIIEALVLTTGNDAPERDPGSISIYGSNTSVTSGYTLIANQSLSLSSSRGATSQLSFTNTTAYKYYKVVFPTLRNSSQANSMQIAEVSFLYSNGSTSSYATPAPFVQATKPVYTPPPAPVASLPAATCPLADGTIATYPWVNKVDVTTFNKCAWPAMGVYTLNTVNYTKREIFRRGNTAAGYWEMSPAVSSNKLCGYPAGITPQSKTGAGVFWLDVQFYWDKCAQPSSYYNVVYSQSPAPYGSWITAPPTGSVSMVSH